MIKRQWFPSNRGSHRLFCLTDDPTLLPAVPRFLSHASFIKEQVLLHDARFRPELRERILPGKLVPDEPFDPDIHRHTAHTTIAEQTHTVCHLFAHAIQFHQTGKKRFIGHGSQLLQVQCALCRLLRRMQQDGDAEAREKLIEHNLRLVAHVAKKYAGAAEADDLLSVGSIGLIKAINTYEPNKGTQLATYTAKCIENEILMLLRANKKFKNNVSLSEVVGTDKDGNELTLIDLLSEKEENVFSQVEKSIQREKFVKLLPAC